MNRKLFCRDIKAESWEEMKQRGNGKLHPLVYKTEDSFCSNLSPWIRFMFIKYVISEWAEKFQVSVLR